MTAAKKLLDVLLGKEVKQLSPNTQAVYEAAIEQATFPDDAEWAVIYALRAAAPIMECVQDHLKLLAIATELEGTQ
jgi:hypothetical protein